MRGLPRSARELVATRGAKTEPLRWASVTKLVTALAALVAAEEGVIDLDEPAGPPGSTVRHLLAHASGLPFEAGAPTGPVQRRSDEDEMVGGTETGLVVEDDQIQRERVRGWLAGQQWIVQDAANGREALACLQEHKPDLILLDLMMPEMDGFAVVAALQKEPGWRDIPVIVITSLDLDAGDRERLNSGVQSVLVKDTFRPTELVDRIRRLVRQRGEASVVTEGQAM